MQIGNLKTASGGRDIHVCSIALLKHFMYGVNTNLRKQPAIHELKVSATLQDSPRADRCSVSCFYKNPYKPYIF